jgi:hypothetical protein
MAVTKGVMAALSPDGGNMSQQGQQGRAKGSKTAPACHRADDTDATVAHRSPSHLVTAMCFLVVFDRLELTPRRTVIDSAWGIRELVHGPIVWHERCVPLRASRLHVTAAVPLGWLPFLVVV